MSLTGVLAIIIPDNKRRVNNAVKVLSMRCSFLYGMLISVWNASEFCLSQKAGKKMYYLLDYAACNEVSI